MTGQYGKALVQDGPAYIHPVAAAWEDGRARMRVVARREQGKGVLVPAWEMHNLDDKMSD